MALGCSDVMMPFHAHTQLFFVFFHLEKIRNRCVFITLCYISFRNFWFLSEWMRQVLGICVHVYVCVYEQSSYQVFVVTVIIIVAVVVVSARAHSHSLLLLFFFPFICLLFFFVRVHFRGWIHTILNTLFSDATTLHTKSKSITPVSRETYVKLHT